MITIGIVMFMTAGLLMFTTLFKQLQYEYGMTVKLTNDGRILLNKMVWGTRAQAQANREGIWEARTFQIVSPVQLLYTDTSGATHEVRRNGLKVETRLDGGPWMTLYDANGAAVDDPTSYFLSLDFSQLLNDVIQIRMVLGQRMVGRWYYASLATQVFTRN